MEAVTLTVAATIPQRIARGRFEEQNSDKIQINMASVRSLALRVLFAFSRLTLRSMEFPASAP